MPLARILYIAAFIINFLVTLFSPLFIRYYGNFSHPSVLKAYSYLPHWFVAWTNFDGVFYLRIAENSYSQFEQAFFPLYPILIRQLSFIFDGNYLITGIIISNLCLIIGLYMFQKYLNLVLKNKQWILWTLIFLMVFPTSFFFFAVYTESLFFLFTVCFFYFLKKERYFLAGCFSALAASTRLIGVFLFVPALIYLWRREDTIFFRSSQPNKKKNTYRAPNLSRLAGPTSMVLAPFVVLGAYCFYLYKTTGDALAFFHSQTAFLAGRSTSFILFPQVYYRYLKIFLNIPWSITYFVSILEIATFTAVFFGLIYYIYKNYRNTDLLALSAFSLVNVLVPSLTGTFLSIPRFALLSLAVFIMLGGIKNKVFRILILVTFVVLHVVLLALFTQGYFVS